MRNFFAGFGGGSGAIAAGIACLVLIAAGFWIQSGRGLPDAPDEIAAIAPAVDAPQPSEQQASETATSAPATADDAASADTSETPVVEGEAQEAAAPKADDAAELASQSAEVETEEAAAPAAETAPAFDEVRREADGVTVIAGRGTPGAEVQVLQNGMMVASATADRSGKFATIALIPPDGEGHVLTLMQVTDGVEQLSDGEIILAPLDPPAVVAEVAQPQAQDTSAENVAAPKTERAETASVSETVTAGLEPEDEVQPAETTENPQASADLAAPTTNEPTTEAGQAESTTTAQTAPQDNAPDAPQSVIAAATPTETVGEQANAQNPQSDAALENAPVAVLRSTSEGVELLNTPSPEVMDNVAIDTISYSDAGQVQLSGRAQSEAKAVRVYLDNNVVVNLPVDDEGRWRGDLPQVDEGIYTLRIDEVAADGEVTSRVETPFKREAPATLAAAAADQQGPISAITVQKGATLWAIARERYGDGQLYVRVFEANRQSIRDPDLIYPGQIFDLPN